MAYQGSKIAELVRQRIKAFKPYEWEPSNEELAALAGIEPNKIIRFDVNTIPFRPASLLKALAEMLESIAVNEYPDTSYSHIRKLISNYAKVQPDQIVMTNGADEAIDLIVKTFISSGDEVIISTPTYAMYRVASEIADGRVIEVLRKGDFQDDFEAILNSAGPKAKLVFLCSPNNPTGNVAPREGVKALLEKARCVTAVDESYFEFCGKTVADLTASYPNLVVIRSFSKAFGLAGARVGYIVVNEDTASWINRVRPPNSLSLVSLALAELALKHVDLMRANVKAIIRERERVIGSLKEVPGISVFPSEANFFVVRFLRRPLDLVYRNLLKRGIVARDVSDLPMLAGSLRFSVRAFEDNNALLRAIEESAP